MLYLGQHGKLTNIHVRRVKQLRDGIVDYLFKHIKRRSFSLDQVLILPQSVSEKRDTRIEPDETKAGPPGRQVPVNREAIRLKPQQATR
jgi:hypothetical protein